jgi:hypothetical protein
MAVIKQPKGLMGLNVCGGIPATLVEKIWK